MTAGRTLPGACPRCGHRSTLVAFLVEATAHEAVGRALALPEAISRRLLAYVDLFAPPKRDLTLDRINAVLGGVLAIVDAGTVTHREAEYPAPLAAIGAALDAIQTNREAGTLRLPLRSHKYLASVIAGQASEAAAAMQRQREAQRPLHASHLPAGSRSGTPRPASEVAADAGAGAARKRPPDGWKGGLGRREP